MVFGYHCRTAPPLHATHRRDAAPLPGTVCMPIPAQSISRISCASASVTLPHHLAKHNGTGQRLSRRRCRRRRRRRRYRHRRRVVAF